MGSHILAVFTAVVLTIGVQLWRCASKRKRGAVSDHARAAEIMQDPRVDQDVPAPARDDHEDVPDIFLSHSGRQKPFVENLYDALRKANHTAFLDKHTLEKGVPFPPHIVRAARGCKLGVIVLSDDFLQSKWPMLELELLVMQRGPHAKILPLFYKLGTEDLKSGLSKWQETWKSKFPEQEKQWTQAVKALKNMSGEVFIPGTNENTYIQRVVSTICNLLPSPVLYDLPQIKGQQRLAQVVASQFQNVCMLGLHGVGGLGKTTICKMMVNFYNSQYSGRSCLIEFPSDGNDGKIVQVCQNALRTLTNLSNEHVVSKAHDFDQVVRLMRENLSRYDVFLAIDNVWEISREKAERILGVGFSARSKILVTSRSDQVLKELAEGHRKTLEFEVCPLPCPDCEEAFEIFQEIFHSDLSSLGVERSQLDLVLYKCRFQGAYHPLALKALSQIAKRVCVGPHPLPHILKQISNIDHGLESVDKLIAFNYKNLPEHKQRMFLDIVAVLMRSEGFGSLGNVGVSYAKALQWLSVLYEASNPEFHIGNLIYELALDGLVQIEKDGQSKTMITVHDLYFDLAKREATSSSRFLMHGSTRLEESIEWKSLERVILDFRDKSIARHFFEKLPQKECRKLQVLFGDEIECELDISRTPSLCILKLWFAQIRGIENWSAAGRLAIVHLRNLSCSPPLKPIPSLPRLEELIIEDVTTVEGPPNLNGCQHLKKLVLAGEKGDFMNESQKSCSEDYFNSLTNLKWLEIKNFDSINTGVLNINALLSLEVLHIRGWKSVQRIAGLSGSTSSIEALSSSTSCSKQVRALSPALKDVKIECCEALKKLPDLSVLTCLERLVLWENASMEEVEPLSPALKIVKITACGALKKLPDLSALACLERLRLFHNASMEEVGPLSPALKHVNIQGCGALKKLPDLSGLTCLELLMLVNNASMEEVGPLSPALKDVTIWRCGALKKLPDCSALTRLERLLLDENASMEEVGPLNPALNVEIVRLRGLENLPNLSSLERLELHLRSKVDASCTQ